MAAGPGLPRVRPCRTAHLRPGPGRVHGRRQGRPARRADLGRLPRPDAGPVHLHALPRPRPARDALVQGTTGASPPGGLPVHADPRRAARRRRRPVHRLCRAEGEDAGGPFGDREVVDHMIHLLQAAHDTTTIMIAAMTYFLGEHPSWQERLRAEAESVAGGPEAPGVAHADLARLTLMDQVMKESLRLVSPVLGHLRQAVADTAILGRHIPAGTIVFVPTLTNQRLPEYWPDPGRFDPGRFAPDRREDRVHRYAWAPFGGGAHKCIGLHFAGMQAKPIVAEMLLRHRWRLPAGHAWPFGVGTLTTVKDGLPIALERLPAGVGSPPGA
ncbi:cytochrome P450 [Actinomadura soli]|uniref:Cytochrome P450 n=1 Tax=Actinomadura soli TaxID=2508997 RepID=A0A5C4J9H4_9ACTN|nr:cytochrome P450 [Actinomadura soli]TMQ97400.1 cytochrome P450 [Actinomadura soli]